MSSRQEGVYITKYLTIILIGLVTFLITSTVCNAQWSRKGRSDFLVFGQSMSGDTATGSVGSSIIFTKLGDTTAVGLGVGSNFSDLFNGNAEMYFGSMDVTGKASGITVKGSTAIIGTNLNLDFNILKSRLTPVVTGGIGLISFTGDIEGFPFNESDLTYNLGAGFRWDITNNFFFKTIYRSTRTNLKNTNNYITFDGIRLGVGYIF